MKRKPGLLAKFQMTLFVAIVFVAGTSQAQQNTALMIDSVAVFEPVEGIYTSMRIPALVVTKKGTLLAFAVGRINNGSDWADMDLLVKRSEDGGKTWGPVQVVAERAGAKPTDNPTPIVGRDGVIHLIYQRDYAYAYYTKSDDDGLTWAFPVNITKAFEPLRKVYNWKVLAPGPGHAIQLKSGRLIVPVWLADSDKLTPHRSHHPSRIATIYSDDNGRSWKNGQLVPDAEGFKNPSETMAIELADGRVMLSIRNESALRKRGVSYSRDGISGWTKPGYQEDIFEPVCMGSIIKTRFKGKEYFLFVNPGSEKIEKHPRENLTIKISSDQGKTWPVHKVINKGFSGYSDIAVGADNMIYVLYETRSEKGKGLALILKKMKFEDLLK
ncbi:MAG: sialidase family protein [Niabella sp.]